MPIDEQQPSHLLTDIPGSFSTAGQIRMSSGGGNLPPMHFGSGGAMSAGNSSMTRQARRLYVGNISSSTNETEIATFFNGKMRGLLGPAGQGDSVLSVQINHEKSYAFVEVSGNLDLPQYMD